MTLAPQRAWATGPRRRGNIHERAHTQRYRGEGLGRTLAQGLASRRSKKRWGCTRTAKELSWLRRGGGAAPGLSRSRSQRERKREDDRAREKQQQQLSCGGSRAETRQTSLCAEAARRTFARLLSRALYGPGLTVHDTSPLAAAQ